MTRTRTRLAIATAATTVAALGTVLVPGAAQAAPDTTCQKAGIKALQGAGALDDVARDGLPIADAVALYGVTVRPGADITDVPDPLPLSLILADHRAGTSSLFVYPWDGCS
jgi:hypothetical protein